MTDAAAHHPPTNLPTTDLPTTDLPTTDLPTANHTDGTACSPARRRGPDPLALAAGLVALGVAGTALLGDVGWASGLDIRWVLAAVAIVVGLILVINSVRPRRR